MLEGYDKDWIYTDGTRRFANYTNLDAGVYFLKVKGSNNDGVWNETASEIKLIITPPYWQTWWFKLSCVLITGMILYAIFYYRMQKLRDIHRIRNKIASDLHDDLGATLSSISIMSELVNKQVKDQSAQASSLLEKIGSSSRNMIESVNDLVTALSWEDDVKPKQKQLLFDLTDDEKVLTEFLRENPNVHVDEMVSRMNTSPGSLAATLLGLEMKGAVLALPGKRYRAA